MRRCIKERKLRADDDNYGCMRRVAKIISWWSMQLNLIQQIYYRYVEAGSGQKSISFSVPNDDCGTDFRQEIKTISNTIIFQMDETVQVRLKIARMTSMKINRRNLHFCPTIRKYGTLPSTSAVSTWRRQGNKERKWSSSNLYPSACWTLIILHLEVKVLIAGWTSRKEPIRM